MQVVSARAKEKGGGHAWRAARESFRDPAVTCKRRCLRARDRALRMIGMRIRMARITVRRLALYVLRKP